MSDFLRLIDDAWQKEGSLRRLGLRPAANKEIQAALIPPGGDWRCVAEDGCITRSVHWNGAEVALINPRGDLGDGVEGQIAMAVRALPVLDKALRTIGELAKAEGNADLIADIARAAIAYVEEPAPSIREPEEENDDDDDREDDL